MPGTNVNRKQQNERMLSASKDSYVQSYSNLKGRPHEEKAIPLLQKIASLVKPIMRKHGWILPLLSEFSPDNPNLVGLNVNGGQQILLRLRPATAPNTFYSEEDIVSVMLHELTHNVHGPHDQQFYKYLAGLEQEYEELQRSGYSGEGFFSKGHRVGQDLSHDLPPHLARLKALEAAERRARNGLLTSGSGSKLGGNRTNKTPRELAAEAAERRARDEKSCASGESAEAEAAKAARDGTVHKATDLPDLWPCAICTYLNSPLALQCEMCLTQRSNLHNSPEVIDISDDDDVAHTPSPDRPSTVVRDAPNSTIPVNSVPAGGTKRRRIDNSTTPSSETKSSFSVSSGSRSNSKTENSQSSSLPTVQPVNLTEEWSCTSCTFLNPPSALQCEICLESRPIDPSAGWTCMSCGETGMPAEFWTCRFCGWVKLQS